MESAPPPGGLIRGSFDLRTLAGDAGLAIGGALAANLVNYVFHFVISRRLGPDDYGTLTALLAIAALVGVIASALNTVALQETARLWVGHRDEHVTSFVRHTALAVIGIAIAIGLALVLVSLVLGPYLHITGFAIWAMFATYCGAATATSFWRGCSQGAHRFGIFATSLVGESIVKLVVAVGLVTIGWRVAGALGGIIAGIVFGALALAPAIVRLGHSAEYDSSEHDHVRLGGESLKILAVTACTTVLMLGDTIFAKHHLTGIDAGYYGAAGTIARIVPYGVGLINLVLMPKAAAAKHASRGSLARLLALAFGGGFILTCACVLLFAGAPGLVIGASYGAKFVASAPILRIYAVDEGLFALCGLGVAYLVSVRDYRIVRFLAVTAVLEIICMAAFGTTAVRLLSIAIAANGLLIPAVAFSVMRTLRSVPQAVMPPVAEV